LGQAFENCPQQQLCGQNPAAASQKTAAATATEGSNCKMIKSNTPKSQPTVVALATPLRGSSMRAIQQTQA